MAHVRDLSTLEPKLEFNKKQSTPLLRVDLLGGDDGNRVPSRVVELGPDPILNLDGSTRRDGARSLRSGEIYPLRGSERSTSCRELGNKGNSKAKLERDLNSSFRESLITACSRIQHLIMKILFLN